MSLKRNSLFNLAGLVLPLALSLATVPAYIHVIGVDRYGVLAIAWLFLGYFGMFDLGLGRATIHRIAEQRDARPEERLATFHTAIAVNLGIGAFGGVLLAIGAEVFFAQGLKITPALRAELSAAAPLLGLSLPIATLTGVLTGALQGRERFAQTNAIGILSTVLFQIAPLLVALHWGPNISLLLLVGMSTRIATLVFLWFVCSKEFIWEGRFNFQKDQVSILLKFGGWVTAASLIAPFLTIIDRFAIGNFVGAAAVAFYSVPYQMAQRVVIIPTALTNALFPRLSATQSDERFFEISRESMLILLALITTPVAVGVMIAGPALTLWLGHNFAMKATAPAEILIIAFWFNSLALLPFTMIQSKGRPALVTILHLLELLPYLLSLYLGLKYFGLVGCAVAFMLRCALDYFLLSFNAGKKLIPIRGFTTSVLLISASLFIANFFEPLTMSWFLAFIALGGVGTLEAWRIAPPRLREFIIDKIPNRWLTSKISS